MDTPTRSGGGRNVGVEPEDAGSENAESLETIRSELDTIRQKLDEESALQPIGPEEAVNMYLEDRREDLVESTVQDYRRSLEFFVEFALSRESNNLTRSPAGRCVNIELGGERNRHTRRSVRRRCVTSCT